MSNEGPKPGTKGKRKESTNTGLKGRVKRLCDKMNGHY